MKLLAFGEILFDVNGEERKLGGAPMNFCAHWAKLGAEGYILSAVGEDEDAKTVMENADTFNINADYIKKSEKDTGVCIVTYNGAEPSYDLSRISAYDDISVPDVDIEKIREEKFDVFYFGTLAQRCETSRKSLYSVLENAKFDTVFYDMNLRQDYYSEEVIKKSLGYSDILKINRDEFEFLKKSGLACGDEFEDALRDLCGRYGIKIIIVTLDKDGAALYSAESGKILRAEQKKATPVSAVGAGDSFSACFLYNYKAGADLEKCLDRANTMGAYVVSFTEAIPEYSEELLKAVK